VKSQASFLFFFCRAINANAQLKLIVSQSGSRLELQQSENVPLLWKNLLIARVQNGFLFLDLSEKGAFCPGNR